MIEMDDVELGMLCVYAERYALGRRTYVVKDVNDIIVNRMQNIPDNDLSVLIHDIESPLLGDYGDECDKRDWLTTLSLLRKESDRRRERMPINELYKLHEKT